MKIIDAYEDKGALYYTIELEENVFVDIKRIGELCYAMDCGDGYATYDNNGNTIEYPYNENGVVEFIRNQEEAI